MEQIVEFFDKQYEAFTFATQCGAAVAGVQSGKTFLGAHWAGNKIQQFPDKNGIICAPTYKILQHATLPKFFSIFPQLRKYFKEQKGEIVLPTGGVVYVRTMDNPLGAEGITAHWWWYDEGGQGTRLAFTVLRSRVSMTGGQGLITTTPYNLGALYTEFYIPWKDKTDDNLSFFTWRSIDNPQFPVAFYEAEKKRLPIEEFARRYMGEFKKMVVLVYDLPQEQIIEPDPTIIVKAEARIMGADWGFRNPAGLIAIAVYDDVFYIIDEWKQPEKINAEIIQAGNNLIKNHRITKIYPDPAEPDRIEESKRAGWPTYETNKDILGGISFLQQLIHEKRLFVFNTCKETIDEMSMYHYPEPKDNKPEEEEPEKINDHLMDAMRYAIYSYSPPNFIYAKTTAGLLPYYPEIGI